MLQLVIQVLPIKTKRSAMIFRKLCLEKVNFWILFTGSTLREKKLMELKACDCLLTFSLPSSF